MRRKRSTRRSSLVKKCLLDKRLEEIHLGPTLTGHRDEKYSKDFPTYKSRFEQRPRDGESLRDVRSRAWDFLKECEKKYEGKNILIVTHEYPAWMLFASGEAWSEKRAIAEKEKHGRDFIGFAEVMPTCMSGQFRGTIAAKWIFIGPTWIEVVLPCKKCGGAMRRVPEVADVWYDSGAMPFAQMHWPFDKSSRPRRPNYP